MAMAPEEQQRVAAEFLPELQRSPGARLRATYISVGGFGMLDAMLTDPAGQERRSEATDAGWSFYRLKNAMRDEHGSWYTATLTVEPDLAYSFSFDYDTDPRPSVPEGIGDDLWVQDAQRFPRPWSELPDWHPVKERWTEESWAAEQG